MQRSIVRPLVRNLVRSLVGSVTEVIVGGFKRWVYNFDGVDDRGQLAYRAINVDRDIFVSWEQKNLRPTVYSRVVLSQQITNTASSREFLLGIGGGGQLVLQCGGAQLFTGADNLEDGFYEFSFVGTLVTLKKNGVVVVSTTFTRGTAREPSAVTAIGVLTAGTIGTFGNWFAGQLFNIKINGVLWPMADRDQAIQVPLPTGLGAERANFSNVTVQEGWTYDSGTFTATSVPAFQPSSGFSVGALTAGETYFLELEVLSVSGTFRVQVTGGTGQNLVPNITSPGKYRFLVVALAGNTSCGFQATVNNTSCIIKNISFKPMSEVTSYPLTGNWNVSGGVPVQVTPTYVYIESDGDFAGATWDVKGNIKPNVPVTVTINAARSGTMQVLGSGTQITLVNFSAGVSTITFTPTSSNASSLILNAYRVGNTLEFTLVAVQQTEITCNPLVLTNMTTDRWEEIDGEVPKTRWAYNFDGVDDRGVLALRAINPDGDIDISWKQKFDPNNTTANGVIVAQCGTGANSTQEFRITFLGATNTLQFILGGDSDLLMVGAPRTGKYRITLIGTALKVYLDDELVKDGVFTRGTTREPTAETLVGMRLPATNYFPGVIYNIKINGTLWPMSAVGQSIQPSVPAGNNITLINTTPDRWIEVLE